MAKGWFEPAGPPTEEDEERSTTSKLFWFAGLALMGLMVVAGLAYILRGTLLLAQ